MEKVSRVEQTYYDMLNGNRSDAKARIRAMSKIEMLELLDKLGKRGHSGEAAIYMVAAYLQE